MPCPPVCGSVRHQKDVVPAIGQSDMIAVLGDAARVDRQDERWRHSHRGGVGSGGRSSVHLPASAGVHLLRGEPFDSDTIHMFSYS